jgi:hypothetical protein
MNIFNGIAVAVNVALTHLIALFPDPDLSFLVSVHNASLSFRTMLTSASVFFPVNIFLTLIVLVLTIEASLFAYRLLKLIYNLNPTPSKID